VSMLFSMLGVGARPFMVMLEDVVWKTVVMYCFVLTLRFGHGIPGNFEGGFGIGRLGFEGGGNDVLLEPVPLRVDASCLRLLWVVDLCLFSRGQRVARSR
jgi:hypothetical protein